MSIIIIIIIDFGFTLQHKRFAFVMDSTIFRIDELNSCSTFVHSVQIASEMYILNHANCKYFENYRELN